VLRLCRLSIVCSQVETINVIFFPENYMVLVVHVGHKSISLSQKRVHDDNVITKMNGWTMFLNIYFLIFTIKKYNNIKNYNDIVTSLSFSFIIVLSLSFSFIIALSFSLLLILTLFKNLTNIFYKMVPTQT